MLKGLSVGLAVLMLLTGIGTVYAGQVTGGEEDVPAILAELDEGGHCALDEETMREIRGEGCPECMWRNLLFVFVVLYVLNALR
jgi:hypothetical protein